MSAVKVCVKSQGIAQRSSLRAHLDLEASHLLRQKWPRRHRNKQCFRAAASDSSRETNKAALSSDVQHQPLTRRSALLALSACAGWSWTNSTYAAASVDLQQVKENIVHDFVDNQYYITGNLTKELYAADCEFKDPTTTVTGADFYSKAVATLFDPQVSRADLISADISGPNSIDIKWRLSGKLKIGGLPLKPYTGTTQYVIGADGLIQKHQEIWDISVLDATVSLFFPNFGAPPAPPVL